MKRLRSHLTYANVMVTLLAFVVLCGGTAFAVNQLGKESVGARQLKKNAVTGAKVKDGSLRPKDVRGLGDGIAPAFQAYGEVTVDQLGTGLYATPVVDLPVPAGSYFATASVTADTTNVAATFVRCRLGNGGGGGSVERVQSLRADGSNDTFTLTGAFPVAAGQDLHLDCYKGEAAANARITDASIVAVEVTDITGQAR